ncbi:MAG: efflux RND transporter periplasmic adaptor subunit [Gemmatirosa sp.]
MDIARPKKSKRGRIALIAAGVLAAVAGTVALTRLEPAAPSVERATLWIDTVRQGTLERNVRAPGTLVPEHVRIVSAVTAGRVEQLITRAGTTVTPSTVLIEMTNPDVQLQALEAERQLGAAEANLVSLRNQLESAKLQQEATVATITTDYNDARRNAEVIDALDRKGMSSGHEVARARERAEELSSRRQIEQRRLQMLQQTLGQQLALEQANVQKMRAVAQFQRDRVTSMRVTAGESGVLQQLDLELGQWVVPGQLLARVAQPGRLKAVLRVPETQAKDIVLGQPVSVDTRNGLVPGRVVRVDPAVQNGTVTVEVGLEGALPRGARADLSVDGTIEIERLPNVLSVGRPAYGQPESTVGLFVLEPDGAHARRAQVKLGRASVNAIEVVQGLKPGDRVIISDVSQWDGQERLRIK